tara:strand:- start:991 stop:1704 length:714 start_codon:yes stop_codon:yes gene_type:complete
MGYMDKDAITVDAILTKKGRQMLSDGGSLDIDSFTLSDTGVDYTLWNPDHPSGSAFYGEAIENLPMLEASVHSQYAMRNKLITLSRDTVAMPAFELSPNPNTSYIFDTFTPHSFVATIVGYQSSAAGMAANQTMHGCQLLIANANVVTSTGTPVDVTGNALSFIYEQDIPNAALYELTGAGPSYSFTITPQTIRESIGATTNLTFIHVATGAYRTIQVKVNFNKDTRQTIASSQQVG